jgi:hypothetical protein
MFRWGLPLVDPSHPKLFGHPAFVYATGTTPHQKFARIYSAGDG